VEEVAGVQAALLDLEAMGALGTLFLQPGRPADDAPGCRRGRCKIDRMASGMRPQVEPDPAEMAERYGAETTVPDWRERLVCGKCGSRRVEMVVSGARRLRSSTSAAVYIV
jgi:hypothetical protein